MTIEGRRRDILPRSGRDGATVLIVPREYPGFQVWADVDDRGRELASSRVPISPERVPISPEPGLSAADSKLLDRLFATMLGEACDQVHRAIERVDLVSQFRGQVLELLPFYMDRVLATEGEAITLALLRDLAPDRVADSLEALRERLTDWAVARGPMRMFDNPNVRGFLADELARTIAADALGDILIAAGQALIRAEDDGRRALADLRRRIPAEARQVWHIEGARLSETHAVATVESYSSSFAHAVARDVALDVELVEALWDEIIVPSRRRRRRRTTTPVRRPAAPVMLPGFQRNDTNPDLGKGLGNPANGGGWVPNDLTSHGAVRSFQNAGDGRWAIGPDGYPYDQRSWGETVLNYFLSPEDTPTIDAAAALLRGMNDETADVFMIASAQWLANHQRDPKGGLAYITVDQILEQRGTAKATHRGYRADDRTRVVEHMRRIGAIWVEGHGLPGYEPNPKGNGKSRRVSRRLSGKLIVISTVDVQENRDGEARPVGYFYRLGDWARSLTGDEGAPQLARMMQAVIALDWKHAKYPKRLGYFLTWRFRTSARQRSFAQPITMIQLVEGAGLEVPASNPRRFRENVEAGLSDLKHVGVIGDWHYASTPPLPAYKWLERWLTEWTVVITPPKALAAEYERISTTHRTPRPKALPPSV